MLLHGTIVRARMGVYTVETDTERLECRLRGRLLKDRQTTDVAVIGDRVTITRLSSTEGVIEEVEPRRSVFSRRQPGKRGAWREDVLVANVDQLLVVFACANPPPHVRMIDRYLVIAEHNGVEAVIVANKVDLVGADAAARVFGTYAAIGYDLHYVTATTGEGVDALRLRLAGRLSAVSGPSGTGKSTLLNSIQPGLNLATGDVSGAIDKGRHTTVSAELHPLGAGGHIADTPGLRELGLWQIPDDELAWCFQEMRPFLGSCRFGDCRHAHEPGCAVREAVRSGAVTADRYDSYLRLAGSDAGRPDAAAAGAVAPA